MSSSRRVQGNHSRAAKCREEEMDDTDIINCICGKEKDDGFMIQCEQCLEWQHGSCVHIKQNHIPTHYFCQNCKKGSKPYRKDKVVKQKKRKIKRAIYSSSEEEDNNDEEEEEENDNELQQQQRQEEEEAEEEGGGRGGGGGEKETNDKMDLGGGGGGDERKKKFVEISKNMIQDTEVEKLLHRLKKQWFQLQKAKETGDKIDEMTAKGFESFVTMDEDSLSPSIPKASARPLQRSLRGASFSSQKDPSVQKGIFADIHIPEERYLLEIVGKVVIKSDHKRSEKNYQKTDFPSRHVFFFRSLDLCLDARQYGNDGRFVRRSCKPNSEIKSILTPHSKKKKQQEDGGFVHMGIYTRKEVDRGEEITLGWGWQRQHFMTKKKQEFMKNKDATIEFDDKMRAYIKNMLPILKLEYGDCACLDKDECFIEFLKDEMESEPPKKNKVSHSTTTTRRNSAASSSSPPPPQRNQQQHISKKQKTIPINNNNNNNNNNSTNDSIKKEPQPTIATTPTTITSSSSSPIAPIAPAVVTQVKKEIKKETSTTTSHIIPPSPAGSVEDNDMGLSPSLIKMPAKKRWLQSYHHQQKQKEQKTVDPYPSDSSSSENNIPLQTRKKLSLENYWNQRRN